MAIFAFSLAVFMAFVYDDSDPIIDIRNQDQVCKESPVGNSAGKASNTVEEAHIEIIGKRNILVHCKNKILMTNDKSLRAQNYEALANQISNDLPRYVNQIRLAYPDTKQNWKYAIHADGQVEKQKLANAIEQLFAEKKLVANPLVLSGNFHGQASVAIEPGFRDICSLIGKSKTSPIIGVFFDQKNTRLSAYTCKKGATKWSL